MIGPVVLIVTISFLLCGFVFLLGCVSKLETRIEKLEKRK